MREGHLVSISPPVAFASGVLPGVLNCENTMRSLKAVCWTAAALCCAVSWGQPRDGDGPRREGPRDGERREGFVERLMRFDKNGDGTISKEELTDERLNLLFARADADKDGVVTVEELRALEATESEIFGRRGPAGPPESRGPGRPPDGRGPGGPPRDGFGPPRGPGPRDGFGPPGGPPMPPRLGEVLPPPAQDMLELSEEQREQLSELQRDVDARLEKILNERQRDRFRQMRERRPGGRPEGGPRRDRGPRE